jgi:hypothetical protein
MKEIWKDIIGYEGLYEVSTQGRIKSKQNNKVIILKPLIKTDGYCRVALCKQDQKIKWYYIHRLVASAFIPNKLNKLTVNHINEIKDDNKLSNLEWMTHKENINHGTRTARAVANGGGNAPCPVYQYTIIDKKTSQYVFIKRWKSMIEAERQGGYLNSKISEVCSGLHKSHANCFWSKTKLN